MTKFIDAHYIIIYCHKNIFDLLKDNQNSLFRLTQCSTKPEKSMPESAGQEWASKPTRGLRIPDSQFLSLIVD